VFAPQRYQGNQLAVFDARDLPANVFTSDPMQAIAREVNFQEITLVMGGSLEGGFCRKSGLMCGHSRAGCWLTC